MSWYMLSRRMPTLPYAFKQSAASQFQKIYPGIKPNSYDMRTAYSYTSWLVTMRSQLTPKSSHHAERYLPSFAASRHYASDATNIVQEKKSQKMLLYLTALCGIVGCSYVITPLYQIYCWANDERYKIVDETAQHSTDGTATTREVVVQFIADVNDGMPWKLVPTEREMAVTPGESSLAIYSAENQTSSPIVVASTYNITPRKAAEYVKCVCLEEQRLPPGEQVDVPVFFHVDPKFITDPRMDGIDNLTVSCSISKVSDNSS